jgi:pectinesterase
VRNLTIRDSYLAGDWDGKDPTNDNDGLRIDTSHHIWIDHNTIERVGDGAIDLRKDSDFVTVSWNIFGDSNKALGVGWSANVITKFTAHHNWVRNTFQRNWSIDNAAAAHLYNNYLTDIGQYGTMARGSAKVVVENSVFERANDPLVAKDPTSELVQRGNIFTKTTGRKDAVGTAFDPASYYAYTAEPAADAKALVTEYAGPKPDRRPAVTPRRITVALDGTGDYGSLMAALGATRDARGPVTIIVKPGTYREVVRVWEDQPNVTIQGSTGKPEDVVIDYDLAAGGEKFYGGTYGSGGSPTFTILGTDVTVRDITLSNSYDESVTPSQALAVRTVGDRAVFDHTRFLANQDTYKSDTSNRDVVARTYLRNCYIEGDVDFIYGRGTAVFDHCTIKSLDRGAENNGWITAASTSDNNPYGFLIVKSKLISDAAPGTVHLGRPWHSGGDPLAIAQVVVRDSWLGAHIADAPYTEMSGFPWQTARFWEYHNYGPGAKINADRPQLDPADADAFTRETYLAGTDNWRPWGRG